MSNVMKHLLILRCWYFITGKQLFSSNSWPGELSQHSPLRVQHSKEPIHASVFRHDAFSSLLRYHLSCEPRIVLCNSQPEASAQLIRTKRRIPFEQCESIAMISRNTQSEWFMIESRVHVIHTDSLMLTVQGKPLDTCMSLKLIVMHTDHGIPTCYQSNSRVWSRSLIHIDMTYISL